MQEDYQHRYDWVRKMIHRELCKLVHTVTNDIYTYILENGK